MKRVRGADGRDIDIRISVHLVAVGVDFFFFKT